MKIEGANEVVLISDDTAPVGRRNVPLSQNRILASPAMLVNYSVYSPITSNVIRLRPRLFDDEGANVEGGSTYKPPLVFYLPNHEGDLVLRCAKNKSKKPAKKTSCDRSLPKQARADPLA